MENRLIILINERDNTSKIISNNKLDDDIFLDDILAFEKSLKENPNPKMYCAKDVMKELREIVSNMK